MCQTRFTPAEFEPITYNASSGGLSCPDAMVRIGYYNVSGYPTIVFNGTDVQVGAPASDANGDSYTNKINYWLGQTTPLRVTITDYDFVTDPHATVRLELLGDEPSLTGARIRVAVMEDHLWYDSEHYNHTCIDILPEANVTIDSNGETQEVTLPITPGVWNDLDNTYLVAFVQHQTNRTIYNGFSSRALGLAYSVDGDTQVIVDSPHTFGNLNFTNIGPEADTYDVTLDTSDLPTGWTGHFTYDGVDYTSTTITLASTESDLLNVTIVPDMGVIGSGRATVTFHSQGGFMPDLNVDFSAMTAGTDLLVVADDGGAGYGYDYFGPALDTATTKTYAIWDRNGGAVSSDFMDDYEAVIWLTGNKSPSLPPEDRTEVQTYLNGGGRMLLTGQDLISDLYDEGGGARIWLQMYLRVQFVNGGYTDNNVEGVPGDDVSDGMFLTLVGGDGADNLDDPDVINPINDSADQIFTWTAGVGAGIKADYNGYRIVVLGFGMESINNATDRAALMGSSLDWLLATADAVDDVPFAKALHNNVPNPFNPKTTISFSLDREAPVRVEVYDMMGHLVRVLADEIRPAGTYEVMWDGTDENGLRQASGTYFCRMISDDQTFQQKMTMLK